MPLPPPFGLTIGTERAATLQKSIQDELTARGYSPDADPVMAEYITIMIINNKSAAQITNELEDLIGSDFDPTFTDWLFQEAAKGASDSPVIDLPSESQPISTQQVPPDSPSISAPGALSRVTQGQPTPVVSSSSSLTTQKRTASARSPSPSHASTPHKSRRTEVPTGPRAMLNGSTSAAPPAPRSLLERMGNRPSSSGSPMHTDAIQARIDDIVGGATSADTNGMMMTPAPGFVPDMNAMQMAAAANPLLLQEMMMNQMAMMAAMGMMNPGAFGMQGDMGMYGTGMSGFQHQPYVGGPGKGRQTPRDRPTPGRIRESPSHIQQRPSLQPAEINATNQTSSTTPAPSTAAAVPVTKPTPIKATPPTQPQPSLAATGFVPPDRPQSPTLCKFGLKCTNARCRFSHPSPVATVESGVVLSNDPCEKGRACTDQDCVKGHVSPAALTAPKPDSQPVAPAPNLVPCRFGASCTRPNCPYVHPSPAAAPALHQSYHANAHHGIGGVGYSAPPCRFGAACTRASCPFQHPAGRAVLPGSFHRTLDGTAASTGGRDGSVMASPTSHNRSVTFNHNTAAAAPATAAAAAPVTTTTSMAESVREKLAAQMRDIEEKKRVAIEAVQQAERQKQQAVRGGELT